METGHWSARVVRRVRIKLGKNLEHESDGEQGPRETLAKVGGSVWGPIYLRVNEAAVAEEPGKVS